MVQRLNAAARRRFADQEAYLTNHEPGLRLRVDLDAEQADIEGTVTVGTGPGMSEECGVRLVYQGVSPFRLPIVWQTDGRFQPEPGRHINADNSYCLWLPEAAPQDFHEPQGLERFMLLLHAFLELQFAYDDRLRRGITPAWPGADWGHGTDGHRQWIEEQCAGLTLEATRGLLLAALQPPRAGSRCRCGSGRQFGYCHGRWVNRMRAVIDKHPGAMEALTTLVLETPDASTT